VRATRYYNDTLAAPTVWHTTLLIFFPRFHRFQPEFSTALCKRHSPRSFTRPCIRIHPFADKSNRPPGYPRRSLTAVRVRYRRFLGTSRHFDFALRDNSILTATGGRSLFDRSQFKMFRCLSVKQDFEPIANARRLPIGVQIRITSDATD